VSNFLRRGDDLERELRRNRPEPRPGFLASMVDRVGREPRSTAPRLRLGFAGALTAMIVVSLGAFGGLSYAASAVESVAHVVTKVVTPSEQHVTPQPQHSSADKEYDEKEDICHFDGQDRGHTITISKSAFPAHKAQGDHLGACKPGEDKDKDNGKENGKDKDSKSGGQQKNSR
jgi:hypothetical protein